MLTLEWRDNDETSPEGRVIRRMSRTTWEHDVWEFTCIVFHRCDGEFKPRISLEMRNSVSRERIEASRSIDADFDSARECAIELLLPLFMGAANMANVIWRTDVCKKIASNNA